MVATNSENPSVDEVIKTLTRRMEAGAARGGKRINVKARGYLEVYRKSIEQRLDKWKKEGARVRKAAFQLGVIGGAIASLHSKRTVTESHLEAAAELVERHCLVGLPGNGPRGRWCERGT
jgi:hypothetical protein